MPAAATGPEAERLYQECIAKIKQANPAAVPEFKSNCKAYGLSKLSAEKFHQSLVQSLGSEETLNFVPQLARLIPNVDKRTELVQYNAMKSADSTYIFISLCLPGGDHQIRFV